MPKDPKAKDEEGTLLLTREIIAHRGHPKHRGGQHFEHALRSPVTSNAGEKGQAQQW